MLKVAVPFYVTLLEISVVGFGMRPWSRFPFVFFPVFAVRVSVIKAEVFTVPSFVMAIVGIISIIQAAIGVTVVTFFGFTQQFLGFPEGFLGS
jgi:hypothetical protein